MSQLLFVRLAKTCGTSVRRILKASAANSFDALNHPPSFAFAMANVSIAVASIAVGLGPIPWRF